MKVNKDLRVKNGKIAYQQFIDKIKDIKLDKVNYPEMKKQVFKDEEPDDTLDEKFRIILNIQSQKIKDLMLIKRGNSDDPKENMFLDPITKKPRTNAELIGYILGKQPDNFNINQLLLDYIDSAFEDLDNYCQCIMYNFKILKKFINESYNKIFGK